MNKYTDSDTENVFEVSIKCREDDILLYRSYRIYADNIFEAKLEADEKIETVHALKEIIEEAVITIYNTDINDWEIIFKYDCSDQDNIVNNSPIYEKDYLRIDKNILKQLREISNEKNIPIDDLLKSMIENYAK